jgi:transposase-like protein
VLFRSLRGQHPYVFLDGIWLKRSWGGEVKNVSILVAIGVDQDGFREVLGVMEGAKEDKASWVNFMRHLKERGLSGVRLFISDKCLGHRSLATRERYLHLTITELKEAHRRFYPREKAGCEGGPK